VWFSLRFGGCYTLCKSTAMTMRLDQAILFPKE
jgi:hypothetical protein